MFYKNKLFLDAIVFQSKRFFIYSSKKGVNIDTIARLQRPIDLSFTGILNWFNKKEKEQLLKKHSYNEALVNRFGVELAAAQFILALGGRIKFKYSNAWINDAHSIPLIHQNTLEIEAVDVHKTEFMYNSFDNIQLTGVQYLDLSECSNIDDWCIERLVHFRDTLHYLDVSKCSNVTERGLATLHRIKKLKRLKICEMPCVQNVELLQVMLEEQLPQCCITTHLNLHGDNNIASSNNQLNSENVNKLLMPNLNNIKIEPNRNSGIQKDTGNHAFKNTDHLNRKDVDDNVSLGNGSTWINNYFKRFKI